MPVEVVNLTHTYNPDSPFSAAALKGVSFTIDDGEFLGIIGHTGSGKSTLIQHLNGLIRPTSGTVVVDGMDISSKSTDLRRVRRRVGLVFQYPEYQLFEETVQKDIAFGPHNLGLDGDEVERRVEEACRLVGLPYEAVRDKSPFELSGGQKRRVAIAGVLAMEPKVLILDEPTAGLDPAGRDAILSRIEEWHAAGTTIVMVSHSMEDVARLADRILVLDHGNLAMTGTPREVFADAERLTQMGLDVPAVTRLAMELNARGIGVPRDLYTVEEMEEALWRAFGKGEAEC
ncbi:MAG: energy-coupling factor transporter ATPase [Candidatus Spyradocola sp.]|jgi:energy-coupling factor transport system ATP-binding protein